MVYPDNSWTENANCYQVDENKNFLVDVNIFFPARDKDTYKTIADEARSYCFGGNGKPACPVQKQCLWYALECEAEYGIWGGLSNRERNALVRKWNKQYKDKMTLKEYVFQLPSKGKK